MADEDLFLREVDEDLRKDRLNALWKSYGPALIALAVLIVVGVGGYRGWDYYTTKQANESGDRFLAALEQAASGNADAAAEQFNALAGDGYGSYPLLARMRAATELAKTDATAAVAAFDAIAGDSTADNRLRDLARIRAAYLLVDLGDYAAVAQRAEPLTAGGNAWRFSAKEALALAAWKGGDNTNAQRLFEEIAGDDAAPSALAQRAGLMLDLIGATGS